MTDHPDMVLEDWTIETTTTIRIPYDEVFEYLQSEFTVDEVCDALFSGPMLQEVEEWCLATRRQMPREHMLRDCPCCGSSNICISKMTADDRSWITCNECSMQTAIKDTAEEAMDAWNRRS